MDNMIQGKVNGATWTETVNPDDIIGRMHSATESAAAIIESVESEYFPGTSATNDALMNIKMKYGTIGALLRGALELLRVAEEENIKWNTRPAEQIRGE